MPPPHLTTIDDVLAALDVIIDRAIRDEDALGYFAVLYRRVTVAVKEGIAAGYFDDGPRMERLDVVFAKRYIDAYYDYRAGRPVTRSWAFAFELAPRYWPIVLQHLLGGINAHINLDLGIAAVATAGDRPIGELADDFNRINTILASLVEEMQDNLCNIWPRLRWILQRTRQIDNHLVDFSMELARDGAWTFAQSLAALPPDARDPHIAIRDEKVAHKGRVLTGGRSWVVQVALRLIRLGERGTVARKIEHLRGTHVPVQRLVNG